MEEILLKFPSNNSLNRLINVNSATPTSSILQNAYNFNNNRVNKRFKSSREEIIKNSIEKLEDSIDLILNGRAVSESFNEYYHLVENNCKNGNFLTLYNILKSKISEYWDDEFKDKVLENLTKEGAMLQLIKYWELWDSKLQKLKLIFLYLENNYLIFSKSKKTIQQYGCDLFCESFLKLNSLNTGTRLFEPNELKTRYLVFEDFVNYLRDYLRFKTNDDKICQFLQIVKELDKTNMINFPTLVPDLLFKVFDDFELDWIVKTIKGVQIVNEDYLNNAIRQIEEMAKILDIYFVESRTYANSIYFKMSKILIFDKLDLIYEYLLPKLISKNPIEVASLYLEFVKWEYDKTSFTEVYSKILQTKINEIFVKDENELITNLLNFKDEAYVNYNVMFKGNLLFEMKLRDSFKKTINTVQNLKIVVDKLNKYIDYHLKNNFGNKLSRFEEIFKYIEDKELFKETYSLQLSRRLIFNKTKLKLEKFVISRLCNVSGPDFTKSLEIMVEDISQSLEMSKEYCSNADDLNFNFKALTLNSIHWNNVKRKQELVEYQFKVPKIFQARLDDFESKWQISRNSSKNIQWFYNLNQLTLVRFFQNKEKQIFVNFLQGCILLLFNDHECLSYDQIRDSLQIEQDQVLVNHLKSLSSSGKYSFLQTSVSGNTELYSINENFTSKSSTIRASIPVQLTNTITTTATTSTRLQSLEQEDKIRSVIIRILKQDKKLSHNSLINKISSTFYTIDTLLLKPIIEKLIYDEFIRRVEMDQYEYIP